MIIKLLNENFNNIAYLPKNQLDAFNNIYRDYYKNYNIEKVKISDLLRDDPGLNDNDDLGSYHEIIWGDDVNKYKYDPSKNNRGSEVPSVVYKNGKYYINDGRHRIKALANSGYEYIELPVLREMLLEDNDDNNSGEEEIKLTSHLNYPDMVYDYVFRVSWGRDTLAARFTKRDCKDNVAGYPFTAAWTSLNLKGGSQLSFLTSADVEEFLSESINMFRGTNIYVSKSKQKVVRIDVNGKVPCYVGVDYLNSTYGDKEGYIHPVIQKRLDEATPTANTIAKNVDKETIDKKKTTSRNKINDVVIECLENLKRLTESANGEVLNWEDLDLENPNTISNIDFVFPINIFGNDLVNIIPGRYVIKEVCDKVNQLRIRLNRVAGKKWAYVFAVVQEASMTTPSASRKSLFSAEMPVTNKEALEAIEQLNKTNQLIEIIGDVRDTLDKYFDGVFLDRMNVVVNTRLCATLAGSPAFSLYFLQNTATPKLVWIHLSTYCDEDIELKVYNNIDEIVKDATNLIFKKLSAKAPWAEINEELLKTIISGGKKYTETKYLKISDLLS